MGPVTHAVLPAVIFAIAAAGTALVWGTLLENRERLARRD